jgi:hypothetical protein
VGLLVMRVQQLKSTFSIIVRRNSRVLCSIRSGGKRPKFGNWYLSLHSLCLFSPYLSIFSLALFLSFAIC